MALHGQAQSTKLATVSLTIPGCTQNVKARSQKTREIEIREFDCTHINWNKTKITDSNTSCRKCCYLIKDPV